MPNASELFKSSAIIVTGGTIDGVAIGGTTPAAGTFTTINATGNVSTADSMYVGIDSFGNLKFISGKTYIQSASSVYVNIDTNGNDATSAFFVKHNGVDAAGTNIFSVGGNEDGVVDAVRIRGDSQKLIFGASGPTDSYVEFVSGTGLTFYDSYYGATRTLVELANIVYDTTPQLGGDLDANGHTIHFGTAENTQTPTGTTATINLGAENHHTLNCGTATGTITLTLTVPAGPTAGTILIVQDDAPKDITWSPSSGSAIWFGTEPTWASDTSVTRCVSWRWDATNLYLSATEATT